MTQHTWVNLHEGGRLEIACWTCGKYKSGEVNSTCEEELSRSGWRWGPGQIDDPFRYMREDGITPPGIPSAGATAWSFPTAPSEDIPGLTEHGIDKDAYDSFMRDL